VTRCLALLLVACGGRDQHQGPLTIKYARVDTTLPWCAESVALGDFDGDGHKDAVLALDANDSVVVLPGHADGTLGEPVSLAVEGGPRWVQPVDLDGDGLLDLVVTQERIRGVSTFRGRGDGTFEPLWTTTLAGCTAFADTSELSGPEDIAVGDLDGDGHPDVVVGNAERSSCEGVHVLHGTGDGTFSDAVFLPTGGVPSSAVVADFDGNGRADIAAANRTGGTMVVMLAQPDGSHATSFTHGTGAFPAHIVQGDLNHDGRPDLVVVNRESDNMSVFVGKGDGTFDSHGFVETGRVADFAVLGDLDGDGRMDMAVADGGSDELSIHLGDGNGFFVTAVRHEAGHCVNALALADLDGEGHPDILAANCGGQSVTVFRYAGMEAVPEGLPAHTASGEFGRPDGMPPPPPAPR